MPTTREHSSCLEASRATALAAHSAAGLAAAAGLREAARLLRSCEALARAATAALQSSSTGASPARPHATSATGQADVVNVDALAASGRHKKKKKKKKDGANSEAMVIDASNSVGGVPTAAFARASVANQLSPHAPVFSPGAAVASSRVLEEKPSRQRSPHRDASRTSSSSSLASPSLATSLAAAAGTDGFSEGQVALLDGLVSRPELAGSRVTLRTFDAASSRWAVTLDTTGESIRVKANNLKLSTGGPD